MTAQPILETRHLSKRFGGITAIKDVSLVVPAGSILGLIGPNGSGKSTLFSLLSGVTRCDSGRVWFRGHRIDKLAPYRIARHGVARSFQLSRVFRGMTVRQNLLAVGSPGAGPVEVRAKADHLLELVELDPLAGEAAGSLSYGQQRLLELARLSMLSPQLVLLDELFAGVNPTLQLKLVDFVKQRHREEGTTFLIVDHNMRLIARLCHEVVVMHLGSIIARGPLEEIQHDQLVIDSFLGRRSGSAS